MSQRDPDKAPVSLCDFTAYFSEDEWKHLHEWQKELYKNVMKEIHQALISLGPLIATTIVSLRSTEKGDLCPVENHDADGRHGNNHPPSDQIPNPDVLFRLNQEENLGVKNLPYTEGREIHDCPNKEFPPLNTDHSLRMEEESTASLMYHLGDEVGESSTVPSSGHVVTRPVVSFVIKEEEDTYSMDRQHSERTDDISRKTGHPVIKSVFSLSLAPKEEIHSQEDLEPGERTTGNGNPRVSAKKIKRCKAFSGKSKVKVLYSHEKGTDSGSQLWPECNLELGGENTTHCEGGFNKLGHLNAPQGNPKESSDEYNECESNTKNKTLPVCQPSTDKKWRPYACHECEKKFITKYHLARHKRTHTGERPYHCTECKKSFIVKASLIAHERRHAVEQRYPCTECDKSYIHKRSLLAHQTTHMGKRVFQCNECEKCFKQKGTLIEHQRTHTGQRPYQCTDCKKSFIRKRALSSHRIIHTGERPYQCTVCGKRFSLKHNLNSHQRICGHYP